MTLDTWYTQSARPGRSKRKKVIEIRDDESERKKVKARAVQTVDNKVTSVKSPSSNLIKSPPSPTTASGSYYRVEEHFSPFSPYGENGEIFFAIFATWQKLILPLWHKWRRYFRYRFSTFCHLFSWHYLITADFRQNVNGSINLVVKNMAVFIENPPNFHNFLINTYDIV